MVFILSVEGKSFLIDMNNISKSWVAKRFYLEYNISKSVIRTNNKFFDCREFVVGENDIEGLFIYSIDDFFRIIPLSK